MHFKKKTMRNTLLIITFVLLHHKASSQWPKIYGQDYFRSYSMGVVETYDKGFLINYDFLKYINSEQNSGLLKLDINGEKLWKKELKANNKYIKVEGLALTKDNGIIISGRTTMLDVNTDPFVMKLNSCMEVEWCNIYHTPNLEDMADEIVYLPDENAFLMILNNHSYSNQERVNVMKIDSIGNLIWNNVICTNNLNYIGAIGLGLDYNNLNSKIIVRGFVYVYDSTGWYFLKPYYADINTNGNLNWEIYNYPDSTYTYGFSCNNTLFSNSEIVGIVHNYNDRNTAIVKIDFHGNFVSVNSLHKPDTVVSTQNYSSNIIDSSLYFGRQYFVEDYPNVAKGYAYLQKTDNHGNFINEVKIRDFTSVISGIGVTKDKKLAVAAWADELNSNFLFSKYNRDLEYDTLYNSPFIYDYDCSSSISSGFIEMNCNTIIKVEELERDKTRSLKIAPNPAKDYCIIYLPDTYSKVDVSAIFNVTTSYTDYVKDVTIEVWDINSKLVNQFNLPNGIKEQVIKTSNFKKGIYLVKAYNNSGVYLTGKFIVQ